MTLSGYLFARLLDGKQVSYLPFFANRALRLLPLLLAVIAIEACRVSMAGQPLGGYFTDFGKGVIFPTLPNGGWSITVEAHFYILLPFLLMASRRFPFAPLLFIAAAILLRWTLYVKLGEVQSAAAWTIIGHARPAGAARLCHKAGWRPLFTDVETVRLGAIARSGAAAGLLRHAADARASRDFAAGQPTRCF